METRAVCEALARLALRPAPQSQSNFRYIRQIHLNGRPRNARICGINAGRPFSSTTSRGESPATIRPSRNKVKDSEEISSVSPAQPPKTSSPSSSPPSLTSVNKGLADIVDDSMSASQFRTPRKRPEDTERQEGLFRRPPHQSPFDTSSSQPQPTGSTASDIFEAFSRFSDTYSRSGQSKEPQIPARPLPGSTPSAGLSRTSPSHWKEWDESIDSMLSGAVRAGSTSSALSSLAIPQQQERKFPYKLNSSLGRSVTLTKDMDVQGAINSVKALLTRNNIRQEFNRQKFHERPGLKRKRLKSQRWRQRFNEGFKVIVSRVKMLQKQGW